MEGYAVLMLLFGAALLLYAGVLAIFKDVQMIPRHWAASIKNPKQYALYFAKVVALVALAPIASAAAVYLFEKMLPAVIVLIAGFILTIWLGVRMSRHM